MLIEKAFIENGNMAIPNVVIRPDHSFGAAVIIHGYGGSKEEQLGLAWRVAEMGLTAIAIDLPGHGEHPLPLNLDVGSDVESAIAFGRRFGKVTAIGHSSGGRLALLASSDFTIAISPALNKEFGETTQRILKNLRSYRVREESHQINFELLAGLPIWQPRDPASTLILYGSRDVPEIVQACLTLKENGAKVCEIVEGLHSDTFLLEDTFNKIFEQLRAWYSL